MRGCDDVREASGDASQAPQRRVDPRLRSPSWHKRVGLSASRLTHLMTDALGIPPRTWRTWFRLREAIGHAVFNGATLTEAAYAAGFCDSAHLARTSKRLMGVRPGKMLPQVVEVSASAAAR